jgi:hypothetical protein
MLNKGPKLMINYNIIGVLLHNDTTINQSIAY